MRKTFHSDRECWDLAAFWHLHGGTPVPLYPYSRIVYADKEKSTCDFS